MKNYLLFILCFFLSFGLFSQGNISGVVINEVLLDPNTGSAPSGCTGSGADNSSDIDNDGSSDPDDEFVELYNTTGSPVDIGGWILGDDDGTSFTFPMGTMIAANGYIIVVQSWDPGDPQPANVFSVGSGGLSMSNNGEAVFLTDGSTCIVVRVGGSARLGDSTPNYPTGCTEPFDADEDWGADQDGSAVGRNPDGSTGISMGTCGTSTPNMPNVTLPVELISFNGKIINNTAHLAWKTASEIENSHFEVERGTDGKSFKGIGKVEGNGTTLEAQYYSFEDKAFNKGLNYYRLKQVDFNGEYEYSEIVALRSEQGKEKIFFSPNPTSSGQVQFNYNAPQYGELQAQVLDLSGKVLLGYELQVTEGSNTLELDLSNLSKGMYFVRLQQEGIEIHEKLIIE